MVYVCVYVYGLLYKAIAAILSIPCFSYVSYTWSLASVLGFLFTAMSHVLAPAHGVLSSSFVRYPTLLTWLACCLRYQVNGKSTEALFCHAGP